MNELPLKAVPGRHGIADAGNYGIARSGKGGYARAGHHGEACADGDGVAIVGAHGTASAEGAYGIALAGAYGTARSGEHGISVARGPECLAIAGPAGIAVTMGLAGLAEVGEGGEALALGPVRLVRAGADVIAVVLGAMDRWTQIEASEGALVVIRQSVIQGSRPCFAVARAGAGGIASGVRHLWADGALHSGRISDADRPAAAGAAPPWSEPPLLYHRSRDAIVLCAGRGYDAQRMVRAAQWDPDPASSAGLVGLLWGEGDPVSAGLLETDQWMLVRVTAAVPAAVAGTVKFAEGLVAYLGTRAQVITQLAGMGVRCEGLSSPGFSVAGNSGIASAGPEGFALAGQAGWALAPRGGAAEAGVDGVAIAANGPAQAGDGGLAVADGQGVARAGDRGVAVSEGKRFGEARAGAEGVAAGRGRYKDIVAGEGGAAVARAGAYATARDHGVAVGGNGHVHAGRDGVAVSMGGTVSGNVGCLLVVTDGRRTCFSYGIVGEGAIVPFMRYEMHGGRLRMLG